MSSMTGSFGLIDTVVTVHSRQPWVMVDNIGVHIVNSIGDYVVGNLGFPWWATLG